MLPKNGPMLAYAGFNFWALGLGNLPTLSLDHLRKFFASSVFSSSLKKETLCTKLIKVRYGFLLSI
jgi:hypothetical protein